MLTSLDGGDGSAATVTVRQAGARLLAHRLAQRGTPTLGDEHDRAFATLLPALPLGDAATLAALRDVGAALGRHVYSKHFVDATLPRALDLLSEGLRASGGWSVRRDGAFHREASLLLDDPLPSVRAYVEGVLAGYLEECFNCAVSVRAEPGRLVAELGSGRDVNRREAA